MKNLGKLPKQEKKEQVHPELNSKIGDFEYMLSCARLATEEMFVQEHYFTTDKKNVSYYNFCKNANPEQVYEAFQYGLVNTIYPSSNLLELQNFPKEFRRAVKNFRIKCIKDSEKDIFLKISSTLPEWEKDEQVSTPVHIIQIGISKGELYSPSKKMSVNVERHDLPQLALLSWEKMIDKILSFHGDDKVFVNYQDDKHLIYSSSLKPMREETEIAILLFKKKMLNGFHHKTHKPAICKIVRQKTAKSGPHYSCKTCEMADKEDASPESKSPTTSCD